jgi:inosine-uridine nucleoside N-ribohydrolase
MREFNVKQHSVACQTVFRANWEKTITPLDTCGTVQLSGERFQQVCDSSDPLAQAVIANHFGWYDAVKDWPIYADLDAQRQSSVLFDTVAVYLAFSEALLAMETLPIEVTGDGRTLISDAGQAVRCATAWQDQAAFLDLLVSRLTQPFVA